MEERETGRFYFNWINGVFPITEKPINGGVLRQWRDDQDDSHHLQSISKIKDN